MKMLGMAVVLSLFSCSTRQFSKSDYTFYDKNFVLQPKANLRTDGVYKLHTIATDEDGSTVKQAGITKFYKFFKTGQCIMILDPDNNITAAKALEELKKAAENKNKPTLFESYYRLKDDKIIIQGIVYPVKHFVYKYGYVANNEFTIVKATSEGRGKFDEAFFTDYYQERYIFIPIDNADACMPYW